MLYFLKRLFVKFLSFQNFKNEEMKEVLSLDKVKSNIEKNLQNYSLLQSGQSKYFAYKFVEFEKAKIIGENAVVILSTGKILNDSVFHRVKILMRSNLKLILIQKFFPKRTRIANAILLVNAYNNNHYSNYYHWITDSLPQILSLPEDKARSNISVIVPDNIKPFQIESLKYFGLNEDQFFYFKDNSLQIDKLYFTLNIRSKNEYTDIINPDLLRLINKKSSSFDKNSSTFKKIYVSRQNDDSRKILDFENFENWLDENQFSIINLSEYSFEKQMEIFQTADIIIANHGAGLSNLIFSKQGTKVIEIFSEYENANSSGIRVSEYFLISNYMNLNYFLYQCGNDALESTDYRHVNYKLDVKNFNSFYKEIDLA